MQIMIDYQSSLSLAQMKYFSDLTMGRNRSAQEKNPLVLPGDHKSSHVLIPGIEPEQQW